MVIIYCQLSSGDPKGFAIFLDDHNLPRGLLPRYRGNRLHILFHTCGILIHHYSVLRNFLSSGMVSCGGLRDSLFQDFISETGKNLSSEINKRGITSYSMV